MRMAVGISNIFEMSETTFAVATHRFLVLKEEVLAFMERSMKNLWMSENQVKKMEKKHRRARKFEKRFFLLRNLQPKNIFRESKKILANVVNHEVEFVDIPTPYHFRSSWEKKTLKWTVSNGCYIIKKWTNWRILFEYEGSPSILTDHNARSVSWEVWYWSP